MLGEALGDPHEVHLADVYDAECVFYCSEAIAKLTSLLIDFYGFLSFSTHPLVRFNYQLICLKMCLLVRSSSNLLLQGDGINVVVATLTNKFSQQLCIFCCRQMFKFILLNE